jgi:hypothetical protein
MWRSRDSGRGREVTCIACGDTVPRSKAREYDKHGDRWDRQDKEFEHLCKPCDRERCHQPRDGLEARLTDAGAGDTTRSEFLREFLETADGQDVEEP